MKKLFVFIIIFGLPVLFHAQTVLMSEPIHLKSGEEYKIIGKLKGRYLLYKNTYDGKHEIRGFDAEMKLKWEKKLEFDNKRAKVLEISSTKNNFSVFYQYQSKGRKIIKVHKYDPGANLIDSVTIYSYKSSVYDSDLRIVRSNNKSKFLFYQIKKRTTIKAISFDNDSLKVLWNCKFIPAGFEFERNYAHVLVSDEGIMYFILGKDNQKAKKKNHGYDIYIGNELTASKSITFFSFQMNEKMTFDIVFDFDNLNKRIVAGGLYSEKTKTKSVGYFYLNLSPENPDNFRLIFEPFDEKFISNFLGKQVQLKKGLHEAVVQEMILRRDGGILLVGEQAVQNERQSVGAGGMGSGLGHTYYDYYYDDLFVISIHPDGVTHWKTILHNRQYSYDDDAAYSSYFLLKTATSLRFIFNDEIKYENTVSEYVIKSDGKYDRNSILNTKNKRLRLLFRRGVQVSSNEYIVPSEFRNRLTLLSVKY